MPAATDLPAESDVGLRTFDEIDTTLSLITGVPQTNTRVRATYTLVKQALPAIEKFGAFGPAQQTALAQLAMQYCNVLVDDNTLRGAFFGGLDGSGTGTAVFGTAGSPNMANRDLLINSLINKAVGTGQVYQVSAARDPRRVAERRDGSGHGVRDPGPDQSPGFRPHGRELDGRSNGHEIGLRRCARQRRDAHSVGSRACISSRRARAPWVSTSPSSTRATKAPVSRRDFIAQGFRTGPAIVAGGAVLSALMGRQAHGAMSPPLEDFAADICNISAGAGKVPFICFDLAGGANLQGSEMLIGVNGNPLNFLSTQGYATLGLPGNMTPGSANAASPTNNFVNTEFGAAWHSDGAILRGMQASTQAATRANVNGFGIAARSENDTGNNPHNPMYGINRVGADGAAADAHRIAEHRFRRQLDGAGRDDESRRASDQGRSCERRDRPRRHGRAELAVLELRRRDRGARVDDAPRARQDRLSPTPSSPARPTMQRCANS